MSEREKQLIKVSEGPRNVRFETLIKLMELWGFETTYGKKGDIAIFRHRIYQAQCSAAKPHHGEVLSVYVKSCLKAIENVRIQEEDADA